MRDYRKKILSDARLRSAKKGLEFNIELEDIVIPAKCPILDIELTPNTNYSKASSPSIDRLDNTKGYIKGNVWVISTLANNMKNSATIDQLIKFGEWTRNLNYLNK